MHGSLARYGHTVPLLPGARARLRLRSDRRTGLHVIGELVTAAALEFRADSADPNADRCAHLLGGALDSAVAHTSESRAAQRGRLPERDPRRIARARPRFDEQPVRSARHRQLALSAPLSPPPLPCRPVRPSRRAASRLGAPPRTEQLCAATRPVLAWRVVTQPLRRRRISAVALVLKEKPRVRLSVEGHTATGEDPALGSMRAEAIVAALQRLGIRRDRLVPHGFGDMLPIADNGTDDGRRRNRRVQLLLIPEVRRPPPPAACREVVVPPATLPSRARPGVLRCIGSWVCGEQVSGGDHDDATRIAGVVAVSAAMNQSRGTSAHRVRMRCVT